MVARSRYRSSPCCHVTIILVIAIKLVHKPSAGLGMGEEGQPPKVDSSAPLEEQGEAADGLSEAQVDRAVNAVMVYMAMKVTADCATAACWPLLLMDAYGGNVAAAATAAATMRGIRLRAA